VKEWTSAKRSTTETETEAETEAAKSRQGRRRVFPKGQRRQGDGRRKSDRHGDKPTHESDGRMIDRRKKVVFPPERGNAAANSVTHGPAKRHQAAEHPEEKNEKWEGIATT
jgi:hypothetical protein